MSLGDVLLRNGNCLHSSVPDLSVAYQKISHPLLRLLKAKSASVALQIKRYQLYHYKKKIRFYFRFSIAGHRLQTFYGEACLLIPFI